MHLGACEPKPKHLIVYMLYIYYMAGGRFAHNSDPTPFHSYPHTHPKLLSGAAGGQSNVSVCAP